MDQEIEHDLLTLESAFNHKLNTVTVLHETVEKLETTVIILLQELQEDRSPAANLAIKESITCLRAIITAHEDKIAKEIDS